ncbi:MAG: A/G-specific adenine glycosylase [Candidatus Azobacteroides sp.]|nr:A/G-specific adenine glycosylase [Candidatus Azobacteroides sp.]
MTKTISSYFISDVLVEWYEQNKRDLPWRRTTDPYIIWISEIILQQTRVNQGMDYFLNFIAHFPDVKTLAEAHEDEVMKSWQGLGYYSRARNLHQAAKDIVERYGGFFPSSYQEILSLKGIGEYTAAAIASFSFNLPHAVVDGNVFRVLSRLFAIEDMIDSSSGKKIFSGLAQELLRPENATQHNQAIMEFGALHCTPVAPNCRECPLQEKCQAYARKSVLNYPKKKPRKETRKRYFNYFHIEKDNCIFLRKRTGNDIWKNLYELPLIEAPVRLSLDEISSLPEFMEFFPQVDSTLFWQISYRDKHILSHQTLHTVFYKVNDLPDMQYFENNCIKVPFQELDKYAVSSLTDKYLEKIRKRNLS